MKRFFLSLAVVLVSTVSALAMSLRDAQAQAYFLSDKMAYELNLTPAQYDQVYQVNLEYFLNINSPYDVDGYYWNYRNTDLSYILYDWQWRVYRATDYFLRPLRWIRGAWYCTLWDYYHRDYYFYRRPAVYAHCHGGLWHGRTHHSASPFIGHRPPQHHGGMNHSYGKPGKPGSKDFRPGQDRRPASNPGMRPGQGSSRPGSGQSARPGQAGNPSAGNQGMRPSQGSNRPGSGQNARPSQGNSRPGSGQSARPGQAGNPSAGNQGYRPANSNRRSSSAVRSDNGNTRSSSSSVRSGSSTRRSSADAYTDPYALRR